MNPDAVSVTSDNDYLKISLDGNATISTVVGGDPDASPLAFESGSGTITHNLGTVPLVRAYADVAKNGVWHDSDQDDTADTWLTTSSTTTLTKLIINDVFDPRTDIPVFYRIYNLGSEAITSDERVDKIFYKEPGVAGSVIAGSTISPASTTITYSHGQGEVVNWTLQFSEDNITWYNGGQRIVGTPDTGSGPPGGPYARYFYTAAYGYCSSTTFTIVLRNAYTTAKTIYYRYALDYRA